jgi:hypothetical protein
MKKDETEPSQKGKSQSAPYRIRLPGFVSDEDIGLGDVIKHGMSAIGVKSCASCARRADALNRWIVFSGKRK